jgi:hypothetical protein
MDQYRSRRGLIALMRNPQMRHRATADLVVMLRRPDLPLERADLVLALLLEERDADGGNAQLAGALIEGLRSDGADVRSRVNEVVKYLVEPCSAQLDASIRDWQPSEGDSTARLEAVIDKWNRFLQKHPCA